MRKIVKAAGVKSATTYELISGIGVPISSLDYPMGRFAFEQTENTSNFSYIGISKIHFRKEKRSLAEGMSKTSSLIQNLRDPN